MKIGVRPDIYERYRDRRYQKMKEHGYSCAHYGMVNPNTPIYQCDEKEFEARILRDKALADAAGIEVTQVHGPFRMPPRDLEPADRAEWLEKMTRAIRASALLGCRYLVVHPLMPYGNQDLTEGRGEETRAINEEFMKQLAEAAGAYDVTICLENMPYREFSMGTPEAVYRFVKRMADEHFKMCLDTGHANVQPGGDPAACVRVYGDEIRVLHVHDNHGSVDLHGIPYSGKIDWADFCSALKEVGFDGDFSIEAGLPWRMPDPFYEELCRLYAGVVQKLLEENRM